MPNGLNVADHAWFAVQIWAGREQKSAQQLLHRGYDIFLPCYREQRRRTDRVVTIERALFSGYLFCRLHPHVFGKIITTPGVIRIVGDSAGPIPVPTSEVEAIQRIVEAQVHAEPWAFLRVGQRVRVAVGPLQGTEGIVLMVKNSRRLVVSIPLLQRSVAVELDPAWLNVPPQDLMDHARETAHAAHS